MKKIIIEPSFIEGHFLDAHIKNICEYLNPDIYIICEGMFPKGPESNIKDVEKFKDTYTLDGHRGFDYELVENAVNINAKKFPNISFELIQMNYSNNMETFKAYYQVFTQFLKHIKPSSRDIIIPLECDIFFTPEQASKTIEAIHKLHPDQGLSASCKPFFESPNIIFKGPSRIRKLAFKYGTGELYDNVMKIFFWEERYRPLLRPLDLQLFHYEWIRPDKYFEARIAQLNRGDFFWQKARDAREFIQSKPDIDKLYIYLSFLHQYGWKLLYAPHKITEHPIHIHNHTIWKYYYG